MLADRSRGGYIARPFPCKDGSRNRRQVRVIAVVPPTALTITIRQMLDLLDGPFASLAEGIGSGQYAFWIGSGISRERLDDLKNVIARVLEYLRVRIDASSPGCDYRRALGQALGLAQLSPADRATIDYARPVSEWPPIDTVLRNLTGAYARVLDIRIQGQDEDHLLWDAVDVPATFAPATAIPDCEHLCLAMLILEGLVPEIASANWDGLIEAAVDELTDKSGVALRVVVRPEDLRDPPLLSRLLKFHGCAVKAATDPAVYRPLLIASLSQITAWPADPAHAPMKQQLVTLATTKRTLMIGLSGQDTDIQNVFAAGQHLMPWTWPAVPPAHVFTEDTLGPDQLNILRVVYRTAYTRHGAAIESGALLRGYAKATLTALVLHALCSKLRAYVRAIDAPKLTPVDRAVIEQGVFHLRNRLADHADADRLTFVKALITGSARAMELFQTGGANALQTYRPLSAKPVHLIPGEASLTTSGIREMAAAVGLLGLGDEERSWVIEPADVASLTSGAVHATTAAGGTRIFFAANSRAGIHLEINGIVSPDDSDAIVIHSTAPVAAMARSPRASPGRTGHVGLRQISMGELLEEAGNVAELRLRFLEEVGL